MTTAANTLHTNGLAALAKQAAPYVLNAIKKASAKTGVDFAYMVQNASAESGFDTAAKSVTSSATGLYQFIDKTWLNLVKKYGGEVGLGKYANAIDENGHVANSAVKNQILALRKDPATSAMLAAEYTSENKSYLQEQLGPSAKIGATELNLAHFLGAGGAAQFLKAYQANPVQQASDFFPKAANANHNIFYDSKTGAPRTLAGMYDLFAKKIGATAGDGMSAGTAVAAATTPTTGQAFAQLASDMNINANAATSLLYANGAGSTMLANHDMVHWFTARQLPGDPASTMTTAAATTEQNATAALTTNPADFLLLAHSRQAYAAFTQHQVAASAYAATTS